MISLPGYLHESQDQEALEALVATGDMMVCYSKLMDRFLAPTNWDKSKSSKMGFVDVCGTSYSHQQNHHSYYTIKIHSPNH